MTNNEASFDVNLLRAIIQESLKTSPPSPWHITRYYMYSRLANLLSQENQPGKSCLAISRSGSLAKLLGLRDCRITDADYPTHNILDLKFPTGSFDFCVSEQVLEHVAGSPQAAFRETARIVKPGGYVAHTTCFINEIHEAPHDYWRYTPMALELLANDAGLKIIECGGWGNKLAWKYIDLGFRHAPIPADPNHPINKMAMLNDKTVPIVTWIVAQRPF